ncbi:MAG: hypothetical protein K2J13_04520, partial [Clostridia bacterium]|nr:hypothetical protein [Clostridia bacterium]
LNGEVKSCNLSSSTSVGSGHKPYPTSRIIKVVYMVKITAGGVDYTAYSKTFYETGDKVVIAVLSGHSAAIVEEDEIKEQESLLR